MLFALNAKVTLFLGWLAQAIIWGLCYAANSYGGPACPEWRLAGKYSGARRSHGSFVQICSDCSTWPILSSLPLLSIGRGKQLGARPDAMTEPEWRVEGPRQVGSGSANEN
jgi:hypothetical protein